VVLGQLLKILQEGDDPRRPGKKLLDNTLFIFTSDNGAESRSKTATGPLRSNKGSIYEGGHRVPFIATWPAGGVGDGNASNAGLSSQFPITLVDIYATLQEITQAKPTGKLGGEDSTSILAALKNRPPTSRTPLVHHDHKDGRKGSLAACLALRLDHPTIAGKAYPGQWKLFVDEGLLLRGKAKPLELYNLAADRTESSNRINDSDLQPLVNSMTKQLTDIHHRGRLVP
jgi:arylsulfatase A